MSNTWTKSLLVILGLGANLIAAALVTAETQTAVSPAQANTAQDNQQAAWNIEAARVAKEYVDTMDRGDYAQTWSSSDPLFQKTISQQEWITALEISRKRLGKASSRTLKDQRPAFDPHGLPAGPYMVVEYNTSFDQAAQSGELLTLRLGPDGRWRVLTYQVN